VARARAKVQYIKILLPISLESEAPRRVSPLLWFRYLRLEGIDNPRQKFIGFEKYFLRFWGAEHEWSNRYSGLTSAKKEPPSHGNTLSASE
jgi:hypothetical protein